MIFAFWPRTAERWYIPGPYSHVSIVDCNHDTWFEIDLDQWGVKVEPFHTKEDEDRVFKYLRENCLMVHWERREGSRAYLRPMSCVALARHYSGVPSRALFPGGLMRDALRHGGTVLNEITLK